MEQQGGETHETGPLSSLDSALKRSLPTQIYFPKYLNLHLTSQAFDRVTNRFNSKRFPHTTRDDKCTKVLN